MDGLNPEASNPSTLTIAAIENGAPVPVEDLSATLNPAKNGFSVTTPAEKINGKTLVMMYVVRYLNKDTGELLQIPNNLTVEPNANFPTGGKISEVIDKSGGSGVSDALGTFAENHYFFSSMEEYNNGKENASSKIEQEEPTKGRHGVQIISNAFSEEGLAKAGYKLVKMEAGTPDTTGVDEKGKSYENAFFENSKHKVINHYYVKETEEPVEPTPEPEQPNPNPQPDPGTDPEQPNPPNPEPEVPSEPAEGRKILGEV